MEEQHLTSTQFLIASYILKKHRGKILLFFLVTVATVALASLLATPAYRSSSRILVKPGREDIYISPTTGSAVIDRSARDVQKLNSEIEILKSPQLVMDLVEKVGPARLYNYPERTLKVLLQDKKGKKDLPPFEVIVDSVANNIHATPVTKSNVIHVSFTWPDPRISANALNELLDLYLVKHVQVHTNPQTYNLLKDQAKTWEKRLTESEEELAAFKQAHAITSLVQQKAILLERLSDLQSEKGKTESAIAETAQTIATLKRQLAGLDRNVQLHETINKQSETLAALKAKLVELELQGLKEEVRRVKQMIVEEEKKSNVTVVSGESPLRQGLEGDLLKAQSRLNATRAKLRKVETQAVTYEGELKNLSEIERRLNELERQAEINEANYKLYHTKFEEAKISESMDQQQIANISVIEPAIPPLYPIKPKKKLYVMIGACVSLLMGVGLAFLLEFLNPVFRTREDIDRFLRLPVLAIVPRENLEEIPVTANA